MFSPVAVLGKAYARIFKEHCCDFLNAQALSSIYSFFDFNLIVRTLSHWLSNQQKDMGVGIYGASITDEDIAVCFIMCIFDFVVTK